MRFRSAAEAFGTSTLGERISIKRIYCILGNWRSCRISTTDFSVHSTYSRV